MKNKILKSSIYSLSALLLSFFLFSFTDTPIKKDTVTGTGYKLKTIIIDAGHGGQRPSGSGGHYSHGASGSYSNERSVTLALALKLQKAIEKDVQGVNAVLTRSTEEDVSWERRSEIANENKGDLFISLHCNALPDKVIHERGRAIRVPDHSGRGVLLLVYGFHRSKEEENVIKKKLSEDEAMDDVSSEFDSNDPTSVILMNSIKAKYRKQSIHFADLVNNEFVEHDGRHSDGVIEKGILVLCRTAMPGVLVETGFIDNPDDEAYLNSEDGQNEIVASIVRAIVNYKTEIESAAE